MQARFYDPVIGRFYSNDPVDALGHLNGGNGFQGFNRYSYANNNPYKYTDPTGMSNVDIIIQRTAQAQNSTAGTIQVNSTGSDKAFSGHTLEPPKSPNTTSGNGTVRMKAGSHDAFVRGPSSTGNHDKVQLKGNIPGEDGKDHSAIQIHAGNYPTNSEGCILVGNSASTDFVGSSKAALSSIMGVIADTQANDAKSGDKTTITVTIKDIE